LDFTDEIRLVPVMVGAQHNFGQPTARLRFYAGAGVGIVLVNSKSRLQADIIAPTASKIDKRTDISGNDFIGKPFLGIEVAASPKLAFFTEAGYVFGKFTSEETAAQTGAKTSQNISINGLHLTGGVKISL